MARRASLAAAAVLPPARREGGIGEGTGASPGGIVSETSPDRGDSRTSEAIPGAPRRPRRLYRPQLARVMIMLDFLMIAGGVGFFVVAILYVIACEKM
jgi:hypothetical protein